MFFLIIIFNIQHTIQKEHKPSSSLPEKVTKTNLARARASVAAKQFWNKFSLLRVTFSPIPL
jgi:hypothetical protein